ncbi:hypothetical protein HPB50_029392 [Hyalomma asiaticum]|nr:hypothetical protein HPB50_029392 [Hyalomma asiaticum]
MVWFTVPLVACLVPDDNGAAGRQASGLHLGTHQARGASQPIIGHLGGAQGISWCTTSRTGGPLTALGRWLQEVERHAPGVSKVLLGNRLHLAFNREVGRQEAAEYAHKHGMAFFEVGKDCNALVGRPLEHIDRVSVHHPTVTAALPLVPSNKLLSLQELCCRSIVSCTSSHRIEQLPLPTPLKSCLKSYFMSSSLTDGSSSRPGLPLVPSHPVGVRGAELRLVGRNKHHRRHSAVTALHCRKSCCIS